MNIETPLATQLITVALAHLKATLEAQQQLHLAAWHPRHSHDDVDHNEQAIRELTLLIATRNANAEHLRRNGTTRPSSS